MHNDIKQEADCNAVPLCVDLDGTLIKSDVLMESVLILIKENPLVVFLLPIWLWSGKANVKQRIADRVYIEVDKLPYNEDVLDFLRTQRSKGRRLVLATASHMLPARQIAEHLGIFDDVIATDAENKLKAETKARALERRFGAKGFDYMADSHHDLPVWNRSRRAILVNSDLGVQAAARKIVDIERVFPAQGPELRSYVKLLRMNQWLKSLLIFVPLIVSHSVIEPAAAGRAILAFVAFCFGASCVYIVNDLLDLSADRDHLSKRYRPLAAGDVPFERALVAALLLSAAAVGISLTLPLEFLLVLVTYIFVALAYSLRLKEIVLIDVVVLACLYTLRIIAGTAAISVRPSFWLLAFSMFIFFSLAMVKRYSELLSLENMGSAKLSGRGYVVNDKSALAMFGSASGFVAVLVMALYINSNEVTVLYDNPAILWLLCPLILYWISRVWLLGARGEMHEDPVVFALEDNVSRLVGVLALIVVVVAT